MSSNRELDAYKAYVKERLDVLKPIFAKAAIGDFTPEVEIPEIDDDFAEIYSGVELMLEVVRGQLTELRELNQSLEQKVKDRTADLARAQQMARVGGAERDLKTREIKWSGELISIIGLKPEQAPKDVEQLHAMMEPEDVDVLEAAVHRAIVEYSPVQLEYVFKLPDGSKKTLSIVGEIVRDSEGQPVKMFSSIQDVTELRKTEQELRARTKELEKMLKLMVGRELKMAELKKEIRKLKSDPPTT